MHSLARIVWMSVMSLSLWHQESSTCSRESITAVMTEDLYTNVTDFYSCFALLFIISGYCVSDS